MHFKISRCCAKRIITVSCRHDKAPWYFVASNIKASLSFLRLSHIPSALPISLPLTPQTWGELHASHQGAERKSLAVVVFDGGKAISMHSGKDVTTVALTSAPRGSVSSGVLHPFSVHPMPRFSRQTTGSILDLKSPRHVNRAQPPFCSLSITSSVSSTSPKPNSKPLNPA